MHLRSRQMRLQDARPCAELVASIPSLRQRYGGDMGLLANAFRKVLRSESLRNCILEDLDAPNPLLGFANLVFVTDEFVRECKTPPLFWIAPELTRRIMQGNSPILTPRQVKEANSTTGLNALTWQEAMRPLSESDRMVVHCESLQRFDREVRGYNLKELMGQAPNALDARVKANMGGLRWHPEERRYVPLTLEEAETIADRPHILGITRELVLNNPGNFLSTVLLYVPPRIYFAPSEQRILCAALDGATDDELSHELKVSLGMIKKTWRQIYSRVTARCPDLLPASQNDGSGAAARGREKKQRLLAYLRDHPSELRPVSRKLLQKKLAAKNSA
jgi:DNA-binding NarL/FixJ family response regulator